MLGNRKVAIRAWMRWHRNGIGQSAITLADMAALGAGSVVRGNAAITLADMTAAGVGDAGPETIQSLGMMGGQFEANDAMRVPAEKDLMHRARCFTRVSGTYVGNTAVGMAHVSSIVRASNVCTVTLAHAPGEGPGDFIMATGMQHALTCFCDSSFSDYEEITVADQTHYSYPNVGPDATAPIANIYDCAAVILGSVDCDPDTGEPIEDFRAILSAKVGDETHNEDLNGVYDVVFPGGLPTNLTVDGGGAITNYTSGGADSTATLTLNSTDTEQTILNFTGVPTDGSFVCPTIIKQGQSTDPAVVIRSDYATRMAAYTGGHRWMVAQRINSNPSQVQWAKRTKVMNGTTWTPEIIVAAANQLMQDPWISVPPFAANDYVDGLGAIFRDTLHASLHLKVEFGNEWWNTNLPGFHQYHWSVQWMKAEVGGIFHGNNGNSDIASLTRSSNIATLTTVRPLPPSFEDDSLCDLVMQDTTFSGTGKTVTVTAANVFTYPCTGSNGAASSLNGRVFGNLASNLLNDSRRDVEELRERMVARRAYEVSQRLKTVYSGVLNDKCRMVYMHKSADMTQFGAVLNHVFPWLESTYGVPIKSWLYAVGNAPYGKGAGQASGSASAIIAEVMDDMDAQVQNLHAAKHLAVKYGLELYCYEGGMDLVSVNAAKTDAVYVHASAATAQAYTLSLPLAYGADMVFPYKTDQRWSGTSGSTSWGSGSDLASLLPVGGASSPKQEGIDDVLLAAPPAIAETNLIPGTVKYMNGGSEVFDDKTGGFGMNQMRVLNSATSTVETLCYVPTAGTYDLTIWGKCKAGGGTNGCRVYVMEPDATEALVGTLALFDNGTDADVGTAGGYASPTALSVNFATAGWKILKCRGAADPQPDRLAVSKIVGV